MSEKDGKRLYELEGVSHGYKAGGTAISETKQDPAYHLLQRKMRAFLRNKEAPFVLDVGCGAGGLFFDLVDGIGHSTAQFVGVDGAVTQIRNALDGSANRRENTSFLVSNGEALPFGDGSFDVVYENSAMVWARQPENMLNEMIRVGRGLVFGRFNVFPDDFKCHTPISGRFQVENGQYRPLFNTEGFDPITLFPELIMGVEGTVVSYPVFAQEVGGVRAKIVESLFTNPALTPLHHEVSKMETTYIVRRDDPSDGPPRTGDTLSKIYHRAVRFCFQVS